MTKPEVRMINAHLSKYLGLFISALFFFMAQTAWAAETSINEATIEKIVMWAALAWTILTIIVLVFGIVKLISIKVKHLVQVEKPKGIVGFLNKYRALFSTIFFLVINTVSYGLDPIDPREYQLRLMIHFAWSAPLSIGLYYFMAKYPEWMYGKKGPEQKPKPKTPQDRAGFIFAIIFLVLFASVFFFILSMEIYEVYIK
ncbi:hypothetical protein ACFL2D_01510 [Patescibacteria group bacterium]